MADMGDEVGDGLKRFIQQRISDIFREWIREHFSKKPERAEDCFATLDDPQLTRLVTETLREQGIRYDLQRQSLSVGADGQIHERSVIKYAPEDFDKIRDALASRQAEIDAALREQGRDLGKCSISLQNDAQTHALTAALEKAGIHYDVQRTTLAPGRDGTIEARATVMFSERDFDRVREIAQETIGKKDEPGVPGTPQAAQEQAYMGDIRRIVEQARDGAASHEEFIDRCRAAGLGVERTADGQVKFTHPEHPWFEARADTLGREYTAASFAKAPGDQGIGSHDGADIDAHTGVVESVVDTPGDATATRERYDENMPERPASSQRLEPDDDGEPGIDLDAEAKEAREVSAGMAEERGIGAPEREAPSFQNIER